MAFSRVWRFPRLQEEIDGMKKIKTAEDFIFYRGLYPYTLSVTFPKYSGITFGAHITSARAIPQWRCLLYSETVHAIAGY
jgi:hypothetical protein